MAFPGIKLSAGENLSANRFSSITIFFCAVSFLSQISLLAFSWNKLPPQVPIFYSKPWGAGMLASPFMLWIIPGILALSAFANFSISKYWQLNSFLIRVLFSFSLLVAFSTLFDLVKIISLLT